jgi:hypothetical protein
MGAFGKEALEPLRRLRDRIRPRNSDNVKAVGARGFDQRRLESRCAVVQKSRSA